MLRRSNSRAPEAAVWVTAAFCLLPVAAAAHDPGLSSLRLHVTPTTIAATLSLSAADARGALEGGHGSLGPVAREAIELRIDGQPLHGVLERSIGNDTEATVQIMFQRAAGSRLTVRSGVPALLPRGHRQLLTVIRWDGERIADRILDGQSAEFVIDLGPGPPRGSVVREFVTLGVRHIMSGYDHLLFLGALLLGVRLLSDVVKTITAFTVAHSMTLALATLGYLSVPAGVVEPLIAASIVYVGVENLLRGRMDSRWKVTFAFGLVHGFGFAGALRELGIGTHGMEAAIPLGAFNLGVETGQIGAAMLLWPLVQLLNSRPALASRLLPICSVLVAGAGTYWFASRLAF